MYRISLCLIALLFILVPTSANAANRTLCFGGFRFDDGRSACPSPSTAGARRGCESGNNYMVGAWFDVYDYDPSGGDEFIGRWRVNDATGTCVTFPWEGASYQLGEAHPDLYVKFINVVQSTTGGKTVTALDQNGNAFSPTSWRTTSRVDDCTGYCVNDDVHIVSVDSSEYVGSRMVVLDSAQHTLEVYSSIMTDDINIEMQPCTSNCGPSVAKNRELIEFQQVTGIQGAIPSHEVGHCIQMQLFDRDDLINLCGKNGSGHSLTSDEWESCATTEGWADYVATVSWWNPSNSSSNPIWYGENFETAAPHNPTCSNNGGIELMVARGFWDLDDVNNEGGASPASTSHDDINNSTSIFIAQGWQEFENGTFNRKDYEGANLDVHGVNAWDYYHNNKTRYASSNALVESFLYHNCLQSQTTN